MKGEAESRGVGAGTVRILKSASEIGKILKGDVLVAQMTNPDFVPAMKRAVAIITDRGGRTSHAAIVSRELGIPAVVGAKGATTNLKDGMVVTVNGSTGEIFKGSAPFRTTPPCLNRTDTLVSSVVKTCTNEASLSRETSTSP